MLSLKLCEPYFKLIKDKVKKAEGRVKKGRFVNIKVGDILQFNNNDSSYLVTVTYVEEYSSFYEMMKLRIDVLLPNIIDNTLSDEENWNNGVAVYKEFFNDEQEQMGVLCIGVEPHI